MPWFMLMLTAHCFPFSLNRPTEPVINNPGLEYGKLYMQKAIIWRSVRTKPQDVTKTVEPMQTVTNGKWKRATQRPEWDLTKKDMKWRNSDDISKPTGYT